MAAHGLKRDFGSSTRSVAGVLAALLRRSAVIARLITKKPLREGLLWTFQQSDDKTKKRHNTSAAGLSSEVMVVVSPLNAGVCSSTKYS